MSTLRLISKAKTYINIKYVSRTNIANDSCTVKIKWEYGICQHLKQYEHDSTLWATCLGSSLLLLYFSDKGLFLKHHVLCMFFQVV